MTVRIIPPTPSAYTYPLLIKHLLHSPMTRAPDQEIVYRDLRRRTYREFRERIGRLASGLTQIGVDQGDVVAILEWDSDRYHECYFAIPMMGAVMQTVNVSLAPEDIAYHDHRQRRDDRAVQRRLSAAPREAPAHLKAVRNYVSMHDRPEPPATDLPVKAEYEALLSIGSPYFPFPDFDENACATTLPYDRNDGRPKGVHFSHRQIVLHTLGGARRIWPDARARSFPSRRRLHADDADVPRARLGLPLHGDAGGLQARLPGPLLARDLRQADRDGRR